MLLYCLCPINSKDLSLATDWYYGISIASLKSSLQTLYTAFRLPHAACKALVQNGDHSPGPAWLHHNVTDGLHLQGRERRVARCHKRGVTGGAQLQAG